MGLINEIISISNDIDISCRKSKLPKFIRQFIRKKRKNKLKDIINNFQKQQSLDIEVIYEYFVKIGLNYPPYGNYLHIKTIKSDDLEDGFGSIVEYKLNHIDQEYDIVVFIIYKKEKLETDKLVIDYRCVLNNKQILSFSDIKLLSYLTMEPQTPSPETCQFNDIEVESNILRNSLVTILRNDIVTYLKEEVLL